jgi:hypothetical protein
VSTEYILAGIAFSDFLSPDSLPEYLYLGKSNKMFLNMIREKRKRVSTASFYFQSNVEPKALFEKFFLRWQSNLSTRGLW